MPALSELLGRTYRGYTGSAGPIGLQGIQGIQGVPGPLGYTGSAGASGIQGTQGIQGNLGSLGYTGSQGIQGIQGIQGLDGAYAAQGVAGPAGPIGYTGSAGASTPAPLLTPQSNFVLTFKSLIDNDNNIQRERMRSVNHDSKGNIYATGYTTKSYITSGPTEPSNIAFISKIDPTGNVLWTKFYGYSNIVSEYATSGYSRITIDSEDNPYAIIEVNAPSGEYYVEVAKLNPIDGTIVWNRVIKDSSLEVYGLSIYAGKQNDIYVIVQPATSEPGYNTTILRYTTGGTLIWSKDIESSVVTTSENIFGYHGGVDSGNNLIFWGTDNITNNPDKSNHVIKISSAGNIVWQKSIQQNDIGLAGSEKDFTPAGMTVDSNDNVYVLIGDGFDFSLSDTTSYRIYLMKLSSAGSVQWQKEIILPYMNYLTSPVSLFADNQNNIFMTSWNTDYTGDPYTNLDFINVVKISTNGNLLWARKFYEHDATTLYANDRLDNVATSPISVFNNKFTLASTSTYGTANNYVNEYSVISQFPTDGTSTGRYGNFYYLVQEASTASSNIALSEATLEIGNTAVSDLSGNLVIITTEDDLTPYLITIDSGTVIPNTIVSTLASIATLNWNSDTYDYYTITAQAGPLTISADAGSPITGKKVIFRIKDNGTGRSITWTTGVQKGFRAMGVTLPTTTVASKSLYVEALYDEVDQRWDVVNVLQEA